MFACMLESLVLRGSVLRDGLAVGLRLGFGGKASTGTPGTVKTHRTPAPSCRATDGQPEPNRLVDYSTQGFMPGAGRSRRQPVSMRGIIGR